MTFRRFLRKLRLQKGDILLARVDGVYNRAWERLVRSGRDAGITFNVPIVAIHEKNELQRMPFEELERIYLEAKKQHES